MMTSYYGISPFLSYYLICQYYFVVLQYFVDMPLVIFQAVFRVYDTDKDGYISDKEFDAIATNFPFIDTFCVIDVNR